MCVFRSDRVHVSKALHFLSAAAGKRCHLSISPTIRRGRLRPATRGAAPFWRHALAQHTGTIVSLLPESRRRGPAVARGGAAAAAAIGCAAVPATSPGLGCLTPGPRPLLAQCYVMDPNTCNDEHLYRRRRRQKKKRRRRR